MAKNKSIVIQSYDQVEELLEQLIHNNTFFDDTEILIGETLGGIKIHLRGAAFNATITTGIMSGIIKMQKALYDGYSLLQYGTIKKLSKEEKQMLELQVRVDEGSSIIEILVNMVAEGLTERMKTMSSKDIIKILAILMVGGGSLMLGGKYIDAKKEIAIQEQQGKLVTEVQKNTLLALQRAQEGSKEVNKALAGQDFQELEINGHRVTHSDLKEWTKTTREKRPLESKVYKGQYIITDIHFGDDTIYLDVFNEKDNIRIKNINIFAELVSEDDYQWFKDSTNRQAIDMTIIGTLKQGKIIAAYLQSFKK